MKWIMKWLNLETNERKNLSLWMMFGGAIVFTIYATAVLVMVHPSLQYVFWLGLAAHIQIFSIMAGFIAQLVKRRVSAGRDGISITDEGVEEKEEAKASEEDGSKQGGYTV